MPDRTALQVHWGDTDAGGLIYFPRFFDYAVVALNDYFAPAFGGGNPMEALRQEGLVLPAVAVSASFDAPLRAGDHVVIETAVTALGEASVTLDFDLARAGDGSPVASLEVTSVLVDEDFESTSLPAAMRECVEDRGDAASE